MSVPETGGGSGLDSNSALLFLFHKVGGGGTVVHLTHFVDLPRQFEDTFCGGRFTRIHVGKNSNIPILTYVAHAIFFCCWLKLK
jgi:hypothetical protein